MSTEPTPPKITPSGSQTSLKPNNMPPPVAVTNSQSSHTSQSSTGPLIPFNRILSPVEYNNLRFLILDCPTDNTLSFYLQEMKTRNVTDVVRVCEPTYNKTLLEENGIQVHDWPFKDGGLPSNEIILNFLSLCDERFGGLAAIQSSVPPSNSCVAVHCVAGLGRAPVLVAISLIEAGMTPIDSVEYVRKRRRGALNTVQLQFLMDSYKKQWAKKSFKPSFLSSKRLGSPGTNNESANSSSAFSGLKDSLNKVFRFNRK